MRVASAARGGAKADPPLFGRGGEATGVSSSRQPCRVLLPGKFAPEDYWKRAVQQCESPHDQQFRGITSNPRYLTVQA
jgi:hypothetical protein